MNKSGINAQRKYMNNTNKALNLDQRKRKNITLLVLFDRKQYTRVCGSCHFQ